MNDKVINKASVEDLEKSPLLTNAHFRIAIRR